MKKTLALVIVAAMLLAMVPAFAVSADTIDESTLVDGLKMNAYHMAAKTSAWGDAYKWIMGKQQDNASMSYDGMKRFDTTISDLTYWSYFTSEEPVKATDITVDNDAFAKGMGAPNGDNYMLNWYGTMTATRDVTFTVVANKIDNGFMMEIDGDRVFEWWGSSHWFDGDGDRLVANEGAVTLTAGESYYVNAWFLELTGGDILRVGGYEGDSTEYKSFADLGLTFDLDVDCWHADVDRWGSSDNLTHPWVKVFNDATGHLKGTGDGGQWNGGNKAQCIEDNFNYHETIEGLIETSKQIGGDFITPLINDWTPAGNDESYLSIYNGYVSVPETGYYLFGCTKVDNGFYMEINDTTVFELWSNGTWQDSNDVQAWYPTAIYLEADTLYPFYAAYLELDGGNIVLPVYKVTATEGGEYGEVKNVNDLTFKTEFPTFTDMIDPATAATVAADGTALAVKADTVNATTAQWGDGAVANIFDNDLATKFGSSVAGNFSSTITWQTEEPTTLTHYAITTSAEDVSWRRIPTGWSLLGSNDGVNYEIIDYVQRGMAGFGCSSGQTAMFEVDFPAEYSYYQLYINTCWWGGDAVSFAELDLYNYEEPRGMETSLAGDYYVADWTGNVMYELNFDNGTLTVEDKIEEDGADYSGTYTYDGTFEQGIIVYDADGNATSIGISQMFGGVFFSTSPFGMGDPMLPGEPPVLPELVLGENAIDVVVSNFYATDVQATFTATEAGKYVLSAAEGETNASIGIDGEYGWETVKLPYEFELEAGETIKFYIAADDNMANNGEYQDVIDLVITYEGGDVTPPAETGDIAAILVVVAVLTLGTAVVVATKRRSTAK